MKLVFNEKIYGWMMTGIIGTGGLWFLGYSKVPKKVDISTETVKTKCYICGNPGTHVLKETNNNTGQVIISNVCANHFKLIYDKFE